MVKCNYMKGSIATSLLIIGSLILGGCVAVQKYFTPQKETPKVIVGAVNYAPSGGGTYRTASSISSTQTTITLSSFAEPVSGTKYTMSVLNSDIAYGTIAPQTNYTEFISFTGITQNANGTATLTGVVRGLGRSYPYAETSALKQPHSAQSIFILSNSPSLYSEYVTKRNDQTITGINTFTASPIVPTPTLATQAANKAYADSLTIAGTPVADTATGGRIQIGTGLQAASSTPLGSATGNPYLALTTSIATSTYGNGSTSGLKAVITQNDGKIDSNFIRHSDAQTWTGAVTNSATTTISASNVNSNALNLNGLNYAMPSTRGASSTVLTEDGNGNLRFYNTNTLISSITSPTAYTSGSFTPVLSVTIPANTLGSGNVVYTKFNFSSYENGHVLSFYATYGGKSCGSTASSTLPAGTAYFYGTAEFYLQGSGTNSQTCSGSFVGKGSATTIFSTGIGTQTASATQSSDQTLIIYGSPETGGGTGTTLYNGFVKKNQ